MPAYISPIWVGVSEGLVVLDVKRPNLLLNLDQADRLASSLDEAARLASGQPLPPSKGQSWSCDVRSYDGAVGLKFEGPEHLIRRILIPPQAAVRLAGKVRFERVWAEHKLRLVVN